MMTVETSEQAGEGRSQLAVRLIVAGVMACGAALLLGGSIWFVVTMPMLMFAAVATTAVGTLLAISSVHLFRRKRRTLVAILCGLAFVLCIGPIFAPQKDYWFLFVLAPLVPLAGMMVALRMKPQNALVNRLVTPYAVLPVEGRFQKAARIIAGILLGAEALVLLNFALFISVIVPFLGGLAYIAGAGGASDSQIAQAWWGILLMVLAPWVVTAMEAVASVRLLMRTRPMRVAILCGLTVALKLLGLLAVYYNAREDFSGLWLLIFAAPLAGILVAILQMKSPKTSGEPHNST